MNSQLFNLDEVIMESLLFEIVEGVSGAHLRPYNMNVTQGIVSAVGNFHDRGLLGQLTPTLVANDMSDALTLGAPSVMSSMPRGWDEVRARFVLKVRMTYRGTTGHSIVTISGFTDYFDRAGQMVDPNISLIVNSYHTTKGSGVSSGVVALSNMNAFDQSLSGNLYNMSPDTAVGAISTNQIIHQHQYKGLDVMDTSTAVTSKPTQTDRSYLNPTTYIAKLINDYSKVSAGAEEISSMTESFSTDENMNLAYSMHSGDYRANPFIAYMAEAANIGSSSRSFTLGDLMELDQSLDRRFDIVDSRTSGATYQMESQNLSTSSLEGHMAHTTASILPAILSASGASAITFMSSNMTIDGTTVVDVTSITLVNGMEANNNHREYASNRIISEIMVVLGMMNTYQFTITCEVDITADAYIVVQLDQGVPTPFSIPIFADSLFNPILTDSQEGSKALTMNIESLLNYVASPGVREDNF